MSLLLASIEAGAHCQLSSLPALLTASSPHCWLSSLLALLTAGSPHCQLSSLPALLTASSHYCQLSSLPALVIAAEKIVKYTTYQSHICLNVTCDNVIDCHCHSKLILRICYLDCHIGGDHIVYNCSNL